MMRPVGSGSGTGAGGVVRVGVTGHRDVVADLAMVDHLDALLDRLGPRDRLVAVSSLAEGADRLLARRVLDGGGALEVLLPLPADDYEDDFGSPASHRAFHDLLAAADRVSVIPPGPDDDGTREAAYERAGLAVVEGCDVLVALWDGKPSRGRGGTAEIVAAARAAGRPVEVVDVHRSGG
jgi:hypothetical protein